MSIALITGSCGLVGSESALYFSQKGFEIIGIDNNTRKFFFGKDGDVSWGKKNLKKNLKKKVKKLHLFFSQSVSSHSPVQAHSCGSDSKSKKI